MDNNWQHHSSIHLDCCILSSHRVLLLLLISGKIGSCLSLHFTWSNLITASSPLPFWYNRSIHITSTLCSNIILSNITPCKWPNPKSELLPARESPLNCEWAARAGPIFWGRLYAAAWEWPGGGAQRGTSQSWLSTGPHGRGIEPLSSHVTVPALTVKS